ncbi:Rieske (2Fe-2S) protein [Beijerinckia mobilis]|uniref:Rieske (2Fe-2S) protein n=1 Tax=Beijerinckia mobilis TaxID=231434 RepID=UPI00068D2205|nr:Rieske (2Fe-2S) protein [Beijerinckia mobilis]
MASDTPSKPVITKADDLTVGGCAGSQIAAKQGLMGAFIMRAQKVEKSEPPPPVAAQPAPPSGDVYVICDRRDIRDRMGKSFPLMRLWDDGKLRPWDIFIARFGKQYFAYENSCPHQNVRLDWEKNNFYEPNYLKVLMCGKHGAQFDPETGVCISGPCEGERLTQILCFLDGDDVCITGVNINLEVDVEPVVAVDPNADSVLENNGFKLQQTKREFFK